MLTIPTTKSPAQKPKRNPCPTPDLFLSYPFLNITTKTNEKTR